MADIDYVFERRVFCKAIELKYHGTMALLLVGLLEYNVHLGSETYSIRPW